MAFSILSHAAAWPPEDEHRVLARVKQLLPAPHDSLQAGMRYNTEACAPANVLLIAYTGSVIHTDHTLTAVDFFTPLATGQMARAGHQGTSPAVHLQRLWRSKVKKTGCECLMQSINLSHIVLLQYGI